jgi:hypothetical protein
MFVDLIANGLSPWNDWRHWFEERQTITELALSGIFRTHVTDESMTTIVLKEMVVVTMEVSCALQCKG